MDLWIRSQDKLKLLKNPNLVIIPLCDRVSTVWEIYDASTYNAEINLRYGYLGGYRSKDRAIEILDEINSYKEKVEYSLFLGMTESNFISSTYKMPEE